MGARLEEKGHGVVDILAGMKAEYEQLIQDHELKGAWC